jgi:hypothetical protein
VLVEPVLRQSIATGMGVALQDMNITVLPTLTQAKPALQADEVEYLTQVSPSPQKENAPSPASMIGSTDNKELATTKSMMPTILAVSFSIAVSLFLAGMWYMCRHARKDFSGIHPEEDFIKSSPQKVTIEIGSKPELHRSTTKLPPLVKLRKSPSRIELSSAKQIDIGGIQRRPSHDLRGLQPLPKLKMLEPLAPPKFTRTPKISTPAEEAVFKTGERIEARFGEDVYYYPGVIKNCHGDDKTYHILYNDGSEEMNVPDKYIRRVHRAGMRGTSGMLKGGQASATD